MSLPDFILDKRIVDRNIAKGILTREDFAKTLEKLPDSEENAEPCLPDAPEDDEDEAE